MSNDATKDTHIIYSTIFPFLAQFDNMELDNKCKEQVINEDTGNSGQFHIPNPENEVIFVKEYKKHDSEAQEILNSKKDNYSNIYESIPGCSHW